MSAVLVTAMSSVQARALSLDFEEFAHGEIASVSNNPSYKGVVIAVDNANSSSGHPDLGVAFDSENEVDTRDPDLERGNGWATGNLAPSTELGNVLIIQENGTGCGDGICDRPDDEANRQAGTITLDYSNLDETFNSFQFDLIDIDDVTAEGGSIEFKFLGGLVAFFDFDGDGFRDVRIGGSAQILEGAGARLRVLAANRLLEGIQALVEARLLGGRRAGQQEHTEEGEQEKAALDALHGSSCETRGPARRR